MERRGKQTWHFHNPVYIQGAGTAVGPEESKGPLADSFDVKYDNLYAGEDNWELAERRLMKDAVETALKKAEKKSSEIDYFLAGDLLNQIVTSNYYARELEIPYFGLFAACATSMEGLALGSLFIDTKVANTALIAVSSHNATAERQFRSPTEFGGQRPDSATFTVTGAGAIIVGTKPSTIKITDATIGKVKDLGIKNPFDMGSAMAPAAADTIVTHLQETKRDASYYDLIVTGDLSRVGSGILRKLVQDKGVNLAEYQDCGVMIYHQEQPVFAGGSGAACPAVVTFGHLLKEMNRGKIKRMLVVATGALLSPLMMQQKESIPCIAHAVAFEREG
ncbi:stage V sporulation protein AD [Halalkalibacter akibai]|uniref:Stage V sporulation protein AD n=1 Tax=Halalkalibacter akibai (strain ATCC 43226 / DSM 21942 / CIP 109018 / JCM 9157 / 1139) TaxID=1236973 RepID=W4QZM4_HALA3|nr:stage V sporulation protein AD [Halalkalibacter akibai]GAE36764.1 stage V sporulation protein AD [Halalkalibacter akibai JCM 9157]